MRVAIFTQDERLYLPRAVGQVIQAMPGDVSCVLLGAPMATHGGKWKGLKRHLPVFGLIGAIKMGLRVVGASLRGLLGLDGKLGLGMSMDHLARAHGIPVKSVAKIKSPDTLKFLEDHPADLLVSVSCPQIIPGSIVNMYPQGGINVHSAPLPKYRGLMPGCWVLFHGERETAVTVHELAEKLDNGRILVQHSVPIEDDETWSSLIKKTKLAAGGALIEAIHGVRDGTLDPQPNRDEDSTYFSFPTADEAKEFRRRGKRMF